MQMGQRMARLRSRKGVSLQAVADAVGVSKAHIWQLEKGRSANPTATLLSRLACYYGVPPDFLLCTLKNETPVEAFRESVKRLLDELPDEDLRHVEEVASFLLKRFRPAREEPAPAPAHADP